MQDYINAVKNFNKSHTLCDWFKMFSIETWQRIDFSRRRDGLKIFETTITQNLVFQLEFTRQMLSSLGYGNRVFIKESKNEKINGNDLEILLQVGTNYIKL